MHRTRRARPGQQEKLQATCKYHPCLSAHPAANNHRMKYTLLPAVALAVLGLSCASHRPHHEAHQHGPACGHVALQHEGHTDYLHDGHLHHVHGAHADEHRLPVSAANPNQCTPDHSCAAHGRDHQHSSKCGHEAVPHGDHVDYLVGGHLHHPDGAHCDNHGAVQVAGK